MDSATPTCEKHVRIQILTGKNSFIERKIEEERYQAVIWEEKLLLLLSEQLTVAQRRSPFVPKMHLALGMLDLPGRKYICQEKAIL